jgi:hypothetical protein
MKKGVNGMYKERLDWKKCKELMDERMIMRGKNKGRVHLRYKTYLESCGEDYVVVHHYTKILRYKPDGTVVVRPEVWSVTTKDRLNQYLRRGVRIFQKDWAWYLETDKNEAMDFYDGIMLTMKEGSWVVKQ